MGALTVALLVTLVSSFQTRPLGVTTRNVVQTRSKLDKPSRITGLPLVTSCSSSSLSVISASESSEGQTEFELHIGRALDTLRSDYPYLLTTPPDYSIFDREIQAIDPSGVTVNGLTAYKNTFRVLQGLVKVLYCPAESSLTFRMCFDKARQNIRIHWNAEVVPRHIFGARSLFVDGISVYEMDRTTGKIIQHRIEKILMNQQPIQPKEGVFAALGREHAVSCPSFIEQEPLTVPFVERPNTDPSSSLFAVEATEGGNGDEERRIDLEAFENKNKSRQNFGLPPLSEEEFLQLESKVEQMNTKQQQKAAAAAAATAKVTKKKQPNMFEKMMGQASKNVAGTPCESNYDCQRPEVCCDFLIAKRCCSSGNLVGQGQPTLIRVPAGHPQDGRLPRDGNRPY